MDNLLVNKEKNAWIQWQGRRYQRFAIRTPLIGAQDDLADVVCTYARPHLRKGDVLFLSEKMVACSQGRAIPVKNIRASLFARILSRFVQKNPHGIGLAMPETMEMALRECGRVRILLAAVCGACGKLIGRHGWFYHVAGYRAATIDGPCPKTIAPYNQCVVLGPKKPQQEAERISQILSGTPVLIVDLNDFGGNILGAASLLPYELTEYLHILADNPLGQTDESTPMGLIRPLSEEIFVNNQETINHTTSAKKQATVPAHPRSKSKENQQQRF